MSLRLRCALLCGVLTGGVVVVVCLYAYGVHSRIHYDELDSRLAGAAEHVASEVKRTQTPAELDHVLRTAEILGPSVRLYDSTGAVQSATPEMGAALKDVRALARQPSRRPYGFLAAIVLGRRNPDTGPGTFRLSLTPEGDRWRAYLMPLPSGGYLETAMPLGHLDTSVRGFGRLMLIMGIIGTIAALAISWLVAGHALRPVDVLTETAGAIASAKAFTRRVPVGSERHELGRLARTFNDMLTSLEQAYAAQQRFVSDASHELRAPLTVIQANLDLALRRPAAPEPEREHALREASEEAGRLARLVSDLLVLARADVGLPLREEWVELDRVFLQVVREARHLLRGQRLELAGVEPCVVRGDPDRLRQLVFVLVDNAINYTPPGGVIEVRLGRAGPWAELVVEDSGIGITEDELARVFERFYRADTARSRNPGGSGLGLAIGRWIATQHHGRLELASVPGRGTVATVRLPVVETPVEGSVPSPRGLASG